MSVFLKIYLLGCVFSYLAITAAWQNYWNERKDDPDIHKNYYLVYHIASRIVTLVLSLSSWIGFFVGIMSNIGKDKKLWI